ncbi:hypothetical protein PGB90_005941 [Kerria lacca]
MESEICFQDLSNFICERVLSESSQRKLITVEGKFKDKEGLSILVLEKKAFTEENVRLLCGNKSSLKKEFINDIYGSYEFFPVAELNGIKTTIIYPATEEHIKKFEKGILHIIEETNDIYNNITLPSILKRQLSLQWVYNILDHKSETDRIIYENNHSENGFILLPDLKWDGKQAETLYLLALCNRRNIKSIRDLNSDHLTLLNNILNEGSKIIEEKYALSRNRLRIYFHYPPSFYHLHVHFTYIDFEAAGVSFERAHSLTSVINNIKIKSDYYSNSVLLYSIKESDELFEELKKSGIVDSTNSAKLEKYDSNGEQKSIQEN